jgi:hypothetical protein
MTSKKFKFKSKKEKEIVLLSRYIKQTFIK